MTWIPSYQALANHRKTQDLADELGVSIPTAIGHLHLFWWWALDNAPDGNLKGIKPKQIAQAVQWQTDQRFTSSATTCNPNGFLSALITAGFVDRCGRGAIGLRIHDWGEYGGRLCDARAKNRDRMRRARARLEESREEESREDQISTPYSPPKRGTARRRKIDDGQPLSGKHRDKVKH